jgi:hypothetical protein
MELSSDGGTGRKAHDGTSARGSIHATVFNPPRTPIGPVDVSFSTVPVDDASQERVRLVTFRGRIIPVLSAEDLTLCSIAFNREDEWSDVRNVLAVLRSAVDFGYARRWLYELFPDDDERVQRFQNLVGQLAGYGILDRSVAKDG